MKHVDIQVIGYGPAALGLIVAADREGCLSKIARTIHFVEAREKNNVLNNIGLNYSIYSNSSGIDFIKNIRKDGVFERLFSQQSTHDLITACTECVPLSTASKFLGELATECLRILKNMGNVQPATFSKAVSYIEKNSDGTYISYDKNEEAIVRSTYVVLAHGAYQDINHCMAMLKNNGICLQDNQQYITSEEMLKQGTIDRLLTQYSNKKNSKKNLCIIGGSHSTFSILHEMGAKIRNLIEYNISVVHRSDIRLYCSKESAINNDENCKDYDQDYETDEINRFSGLRDRSKDAYLHIISGKYPVELVTIQNPDVHRYIESADLVIFAMGYKTKPIPIYECDGFPLHKTDEDVFNVNQHCQIIGCNRQLIDNIYGLGIGYSRVTDTGVPRAAINVFHGEDSSAIVSGIVNAMNKTNSILCEITFS